MEKSSLFQQTAHQKVEGNLLPRYQWSEERKVDICLELPMCNFKFHHWEGKKESTALISKSVNWSNAFPEIFTLWEKKKKKVLHSFCKNWGKVWVYSVLEELVSSLCRTTHLIILPFTGERVNNLFTEKPFRQFPQRGCCPDKVLQKKNKKILIFWYILENLK